MDFLSFEHGSTVNGGSGVDIFEMTEDVTDDLVSRVEDFDPDEDE